MLFKKKTPWPPKGKCKMDTLSIKLKKEREKPRLRVKLCRKLLKIYQTCNRRCLSEIDTGDKTLILYITLNLKGNLITRCCLLKANRPFIAKRYKEQRNCYT